MGRPVQSVVSMGNALTPGVLMVTVVTGRWSIAVEEDGMAKEEQDLFLQEMQGVAELKPSNTVTIQPPKELTARHVERRSAALREFFKAQNERTTRPVEH